MNDYTENKQRRSLRLKGYDYSRSGDYFVTICVQNRDCLFGIMENGSIRINEAGIMIEREWLDLQNRFTFLGLDVYVVMPNHLHGIIRIFGRDESCIRPYPSMEEKEKKHSLKGDHKDRPYGTKNESVGRVIQAFKSKSTHHYIEIQDKLRLQAFVNSLWQRNYYEHIIRDESELNTIRKYIVKNLDNWSEDEDNPLNALL
jgi:REP element-mobilizing transposase RayT